MTEPEPPSVAALSLAETATQPVAKATEQEINPWDVQAATDADGNVLEFDYPAISRKWATKLVDDALLERTDPGGHALAHRYGRVVVGWVGRRGKRASGRDGARVGAPEFARLDR